MTIVEALEDYFNNLLGTISKNSKMIYCYHLGFLTRYFDPTQDVSDLNSRKLRAFRASLIRMSVSSRNDILGSVKRFFKFLVEDGVLDKDPSSSLRKFKSEAAQEPKAISVSDLELFLNTALCVDYQIYVFAILLADTGCRVSAIGRLRKQDINAEKMSMIVKEKGGKFETKYLSKKAIEALMPLMEERNNYLFLKQNGGYWHRGIARYWFLAVKKRAGIEGPANPHSFRHFYAKSVLKNGGNLNDVKQLLNAFD